MVRGKPSEFSYLVAVTDFRSGVQMELMQPVTGRSIYDEHLGTEGRGIPPREALLRRLPRRPWRATAHRGSRSIQSGKYDEDEFHYLDTEKVFGAIIELGNAGRIRAPMRRYPA